MSTGFFTYPSGRHTLGARERHSGWEMARRQLDWATEVTEPREPSGCLNSTSTDSRVACVRIMSSAPDWLEINSRFRIPLSELEFAFARSSGPGGQNVNKVSSKAQLRWRPAESPSIPEELRFRVLSRLEPKLTVDGDLLVISQRYRDQPRNKEDCLEKLRALVLGSLVIPKARKKSKPSRAAKARRLKDKKIGSAKKEQRRSPSGDD